MNHFKALKMPYFSNAPGPTPCSDLPKPQSVIDQNKLDANLTRNASKRKPSDEAAGLRNFTNNFYIV